MDANSIFKITNGLNFPDRCLVITANFPPETTINLAKSYSPLIDFEHIYIPQDQLWDPDKIRLEYKAIIKELLFLEDKKIVPSEVIQFISSRFDLSQIDVPIFIISNNATDYTPCFISGHYESLFEGIENEYATTEEQSISEFYVNSIKAETGLFVQSNVSSFFDPNNLQEIKLVSPQILIFQLIQLNRFRNMNSVILVPITLI
jgi:hypothetical protein